jgi:hypothetical protein
MHFRGMISGRGMSRQHMSNVPIVFKYKLWALWHLPQEGWKVLFAYTNMNEHFQDLVGSRRTGQFSECAMSKALNIMNL